MLDQLQLESEIFFGWIRRVFRISNWRKYSNFIDEVKKIFEVLQVTGINWVNLATYKFKDVTHIGFTHLKDNKGICETPVIWDFFGETFLDRFFPRALRKEKSLETMILSQGNLIVQEYGLNFTYLSRYAPHMVDDSTA